LTSYYHLKCKVDNYSESKIKLAQTATVYARYTDPRNWHELIFKRANTAKVWPYINLQAYKHLMDPSVCS